MQQPDKRSAINGRNSLISFAQIAGWLFSSFMTRIYAAALGAWVAWEVGFFLIQTFGHLNLGAPA